MNIVEKRDGRVQARACADGSKERRQTRYKKEDGASPTVATDSIMITATIDAHERRDIASTSRVRSSTHTMIKKPSCSSEAALLNSWSKSTQIYIANILSTIKTTKLSYMLNCQRQYTDSSRAPSSSTKNCPRPPKLQDTLCHQSI